MSDEKRVGRNYLLLVLSVVSALTIAALATAWFLFFRPDVKVPSGRETVVTIKPGTSTSEIGRQLALIGVVANSRMFRLRVRMAERDGELKAGEYQMESGSDYADVIDMLVKGPQPEFVTVTIPEGFTVEQIAARLEAKLGLPASETLQLAKGGASEFADEHPILEDAFEGSLEGFLFPKTYRLQVGSSAREVLEMMLDQFEDEFSTVDRNWAHERGFTDAQVLVIASMVEREALLDKERPVVSSVIYNRFKRGMYLEIDATVEYVIPGNHFRLRYEDLKVQSPYNTYINKGLPPGAISNPGLPSLKAAARPAETGYYFYVLTGKDGTHTFATNKADFEKAKLKSKRVFGK